MIFVCKNNHKSMHKIIYIVKISFKIIYLIHAYFGKDLVWLMNIFGHGLNEDVIGNIKINVNKVNINAGLTFWKIQNVAGHFE